jgi:H+/Cl- antiporter ClcA
MLSLLGERCYIPLMRKRLTEHTVLFISIVKWVVLATIVGAIVGMSTGAFLEVLAWATGGMKQHEYSFLLLPVAFFTSALLVKKLAPDAAGHGTEKVIEAIHKYSGKIPLMVVPVKLVATVITLATGGSAGKEGPCAQIGAGLASLFADIMKFDEADRKKLVICGVSAGFAAVFGTPIAGSIFGVEVLFVGTILYDVLLPSFIAGITAFQVSAALGVTYFHQPVNLVPAFSEGFLAIVMVAGIFFGVCSWLLIEVLHLGERLSAKLHMWPPLKGLVGGAAVVVLALIFSTRYLGLGLTTIESCLRGEHIEWFAFILKPLFTSLTLAFGGSGGIVTPIFFVGATAGAFFAMITGLNVATFSAIGLSSVLAGAANTPIAASIMAVELFGPQLAPYATVACVISFLMTGHHSVYPSQILSMKKSASLHVTLGEEMDDVETRYAPHEKSLSGAIVRVAGRVAKTIEKGLSRVGRTKNDEVPPT